MSKDEKPLWMYWVLLAVLISPTFFIAGVAIGSSAQIPSDKAWEYISVTISAIATSVIALLTIILAVETWRLRRNQDTQIDSNRKAAIRPHIEIFLESSVVGFQFIVFKVENIGKGLAKNIRFTVESPKEDFLDSEIEVIAILEKLSFFKNSLSTLGVNGTKKSFLFSFVDMEGNPYTTYSVIDLSEFKGITEIGKGNPEYRTSIELEKIRKILNSIANGNKRINIDSYTQHDRNLQKEKAEARIEEYYSKKDEKNL